MTFQKLKSLLERLNKEWETRELPKIAYIWGDLEDTKNLFSIFDIESVFLFGENELILRP